MALIKRKATPGSAPVKKAAPKQKAFVLPTEKRRPSAQLSDFSWLIYGDKKIGKTSICSQFPGALIYSFEPGAKSLEVFAVDIPDWETAVAYNEQLFTTEHEFKNIVIDTGKIAYDRNMQFICKQEGMSHPSDQAYGKGWSAVGKSFEKFHLDISGNSLGLIIVAHEKVTETEKASGLKQFKIEPELSGSSLNFYHGMVDIIARYHFIGNMRFLTIRGNENEVAGCRMKNNFLTPKGERVVRIPMGESEEEAYANLVNAFNNKQTSTFERVISEDTERKAVTIKRKPR
jgi:hypothetical protein